MASHDLFLNGASMIEIGIGRRPLIDDHAWSMTYDRPIPTRLE